jgi:hypothetical protein
LHLLRAGFVPGLSDTKDAPSFEDVRNMDLSGCELFEGDISLQRFHPLVQTATHIYAFDVVFSRDTHAKLLPLIDSCPFSLFGCYHNPQKLASFGVKNMQLINNIKVHTTGKQSFTCFFYVKATPQPAPRYSREPTKDPMTDEFYQHIRDQVPTTPEHIVHANAMAASAKAAQAAAAAAKLNAPARPSSTNGTARRKSSDSPTRSSKSSKKKKRTSGSKKARKSKGDEESSEEDSDSPASAPNSGSKRKHKASQEDDAEEQEPEEDKPKQKRPPRGPNPYDLAIAAFCSKKPTVPRRSNNSASSAFDTPQVSLVPKELSHYLTDAPKEAAVGKVVMVESMPVLVTSAIIAATPPVSAREVEYTEQVAAAANATAVRAAAATATQPATTPAAPTAATPAAAASAPSRSHKAKQQKLAHTPDVSHNS